MLQSVHMGIVPNGIMTEKKKKLDWLGFKSKEAGKRKISPYRCQGITHIWFCTQLLVSSFAFLIVS